jgi:transcriptional regulator with XRE-family HTH domain
MKDQLKELRKALKLNQTEFAGKLEMAQNSYSKIETGENKLTDKNISLICYVFGVNESWLRTGTGDMFIAKDLAETPEEKEILSIFRRLSAEMQDFFLDMGRKLAKIGTVKNEPLEIEVSQNAPESATRPPEAPLEAKPAQDTEKGESPGIGPNPKNGETG